MNLEKVLELLEHSNVAYSFHNIFLSLLNVLITTKKKIDEHENPFF